jgi:hypothetical protein
VFTLGKAEPLPAPIPYSRVPVSTLPGYRLIYQGCRVTDRIQYAARIGDEGDGDVKVLGCPDAAVPVGHAAPTGPGRYRVDRVTVEIGRPDAEGREAPATLVTGIEAGTLLDRIDPGKPVRLRGEREGWLVEQALVAARYARPPYLFAAPPRLSAAGASGDVLIEGPFRYGYTARVDGDVARQTMFSGKKPAFAAGDALFGIPMRSNLTQQLFNEPLMIWCAPKQKKPGEWRANCLQQQGVSRGVYQSPYAGLWIEQLPASADNSDAIEIVEGPADLPQARIAYRFDKWTKNRLLLWAAAEKDGAREPQRRVELPRFEDGSALMAVGGGVVKVSETPTGFVATPVRPFRADGSAGVTAGLLLWVLDRAKVGGKPLSEAERIALLIADAPE